MSRVSRVSRFGVAGAGKAIAARAVRPKKKPCGNNGLSGCPLGRGGILGALNNWKRSGKVTTKDWTDGEFGVDFDEFGPLPASLDDPRRRHSTRAATFTEWLLVCGLAAVSPMAMDDPRVKAIHNLRALPFHFGKSVWKCPGWRWNGRGEVESAALRSLRHLGVELPEDVFAAVWTLYCRWLDSTGRFVIGLKDAASSVLANEFAQQAAYNYFWGFKQDQWEDRKSVV